MLKLYRMQSKMGEKIFADQMNGSIDELFFVPPISSDKSNDDELQLQKRVFKKLLSNESDKEFQLLNDAKDASTND